MKTIWVGSNVQYHKNYIILWREEQEKEYVQTAELGIVFEVERACFKDSWRRLRIIIIPFCGIPWSKFTSQCQLDEVLITSPGQEMIGGSDNPYHTHYMIISDLGYISSNIMSTLLVSAITISVYMLDFFVSLNYNKDNYIYTRQRHISKMLEFFGVFLKVSKVPFLYSKYTKPSLYVCKWYKGNTFPLSTWVYMYVGMYHTIYTTDRYW